MRSLLIADLTFGYLNGLRKVTLTDRRDKLSIIGYRPSLTEALSYVLDVWRSVQTVEEAALFFADWYADEQEQPLEALAESEAA